MPGTECRSRYMGPDGALLSVVNEVTNQTAFGQGKNASNQCQGATDDHSRRNCGYICLSKEVVKRVHFGKCERLVVIVFGRKGF